MLILQLLLAMMLGFGSGQALPTSQPVGSGDVVISDLETDNLTVKTTWGAIKTGQCGPERPPKKPSLPPPPDPSE